MSTRTSTHTESPSIPKYEHCRPRLLKLSEQPFAVVHGTMRAQVRLTDARWLSIEEQSWVAQRLQQDREVKAGVCHSSIAGALRDPRIWKLGVFLTITQCAAYAYNFTVPLLIREITGYSDNIVGLIVAAISFFVAMGIIANGIAASRRQSLSVCIALPALIIALGCFGVGLFRTPWLVIGSLALITIFHNANFGPLYTIAASFLEKKGAAAGLALVNTIGIVGGFLGPYYIGLAKDFTGSYQKGFLSLRVPCLFAVFLILHLRHTATPSRTSPAPIPPMPVPTLPATPQS